MKILVPTDFSECADYALKAACLLAQKLKAEVYLYHVAVFSYYDNFVDADKRKSVQQSIESNINTLLVERSNSYKDYDVPIFTDYVFGNFLDSLIKYDENHDFDLVVMGSYGASGKQEWFVGSNTQKLIRNLDKNVLVIKNPIEELSFKRAMFPSNLTEKDNEAYTIFLDFLSNFRTEEIHILSVNTSSFFAQPAVLMYDLLEDFKSKTKGIKCTTHFMSDYSVEAGIRHFSDDYHIQIIGISNMDKRPLKRVFQGSNVEMLINHSEIPVLVIQ